MQPFWTVRRTLMVLALALALDGIVSPGDAADKAAPDKVRAPQRHTEVAIRGDAFLINGKPTYAGRTWQGRKVEGLLFNSRMVQATFNDLNPQTRPNWDYPDTGRWDAERNTREFLAALPEWRRHGLLAITLNLQGGNPRGYGRDQPWHNSAFTETGALRPEYLNRLGRVLDKADELGMVVILGLFYFGQDERLQDEAAVLRALDNAIGWLLDRGYPRQVKGYRPVPILFNEEDHFDFDRPQNNLLAALGAYCSWGYFDPGLNNYLDGYQSPPVHWGLGTERKRAFFQKVQEITGTKTEAAPESIPPQPRAGALAGDRPRLIVSTDIGGSDPDDFQSLVHLLLYADVLDIEGLISSPPGQGRAEHVLEVLDAFAKDYQHLRRHAAYPEPQALRALTKQGATDPAPKDGFGRPTDGSRWIAARARADDPRPLYVLAWGSLTDVAQAVHDAPEIKKKVRVYSIGSWNTKQDQAARDYLFEKHPDLWWIEADTNFRGMYVGGPQEGDLGNASFLARHVKCRGALGDLLVAKMGVLKMGDTPSVLYLLRGDPWDPTSPHWGGAFVRAEQGRPFWTDDPNPVVREGKYPGARTVNQWRADFLRDWQARMHRTGK